MHAPEQVDTLSPVLLPKNPVAHGKHLELLNAAENEPTAHNPHVDCATAVPNDPGGHAMHPDCNGTGLKNPTLQLRHAWLKLVAPSTVPNMPGGQGTGAASPVEGQYPPLLQD